MSQTLGAGLSLKPEYFDSALEAYAPGLWFEVHAENYMVDGGPRLEWLQAIRDRHEISIHGVGLSLAADEAPAIDHLRRLRTLIDRVRPALVSEHLAWSTLQGTYYPELLPFPRTDESLKRIVDNVAQTQDILGCRVAIENPAHYLALPRTHWDEIDFLQELVHATGCALLLDVNNVYVGANNLGYCAEDYLDAFPLRHVDEIHLAGHTLDPGLGAGLLIDSHDMPVNDAVWQLYRRVIARGGSRPTLVERDGNLPAFADLMAERLHAASLLEASSQEALAGA